MELLKSFLLEPLGLACPVVLHHASSTISVSVSGMDLVSHLKKHVPSLASYYYPTPYLIGGHLQTLCAALKKFHHVNKIKYVRRILETPDGGTVSMDFASSDNPDDWIEDPTSRRPLMVILHGLTGGSHESYVRALIAELIQRPNWRAVVINFRGCAETPVTTQRLYSAGWTEDIRLASKWLRYKFPEAPFVAVGFSLGANVLTKYLGEEGSKTIYSAAISVGNPWNLEVSNIILESSFLGRKLYSPAMGSNLGRMFSMHEHVLKSNHIIKNQIKSLDEIKASKTIMEFDDNWTAPSFGFPTANAYYRASSSAGYLALVAIPFLALNALDDPIVSAKVIPFDEARFNPNVIVATTKYGGHLGWFQGLFSTARWNTKVVAEFADAMLSIEKIPCEDAYDLNPKMDWTDETNYKANGKSHSYPRNGSADIQIESVIVRKPNPKEKRIDDDVNKEEDANYSF